MSKIIINNNAKLSDLGALRLVAQAIADSEKLRSGIAYCALTITPENVEIHVNYLPKTNTFTFTLNQL